MAEAVALDPVDIEDRLCDVCLVQRSVTTLSPGIRLCHLCDEAARAGAAVGKGYGEFMRHRYERGELQHGPR